MSKIIPTILTNSEEEYRKRLSMAQHVSDLVQIDVIDGKFAKNLTVGVDVISKYPTSSMLEIQLMVIDPQNYIDDLAKLDYTSRIIFPFEIEADIPDIIYQIKKHNKQVGISLNPSTSIKLAERFLSDIDLLLLLAVEPGFSGQKFQESVLEKVREAKKIAGGLAVEIDGGVNFENVETIARSGVDFLSANSVLYNAADFAIAYEKLAKLASITT